MEYTLRTNKIHTMTTIIILEDSRGREVNPLGEEPSQYGNIRPDSNWYRWRAAESRLKTLPVYRATIIIPGEPAIEVGETFKKLPPNTLWRARLSGDQGSWIIESKAE
jgi:hypothetical protein